MDTPGMGEARRRRLLEEELERKPLWYQIRDAFEYYGRRFYAWWRKDSDDDWPEVR